MSPSGQTSLAIVAKLDDAIADQPFRTTSATSARVQIEGRRFQLSGTAWFVKGFTYGPFRPNSRGEFLPERHRVLDDFSDMRRLGCNAIRVYHPPSVRFLDDALRHGLRVMIDVPWEKHRCFFEDRSAQYDARQAVTKVAHELGKHKAVLAISVGNEIPHDIVRFYGARRVEQFLEELIDQAKSNAPDCLVTYTNYPPTEFLSPRALDFYCANVYLHDGRCLGRYLDRLQHVAGPAPLILGEHGIDTTRNGESHQRQVLSSHLHEVFRRGLAGSFIFSYTDEWFTGGHAVSDWTFGVTRADRSAKPAAQIVSQVWSRVPHLERTPAPMVSVVVCAYNGAETLRECLQSLSNLDYPDYEIILIDDGSTDQTPTIAKEFPSVRYVRQSNQGLSAARNAGARLARGEIVAYTDSDCVADRFWLLCLTQAMEDQGVDAIGGPNSPPRSDRWTAQCVAVSPGGPSHVMLDDRRAEHVPGCNMAFRRNRLLSLGGFDPQFRDAGDDVDLCWRFLEAGLQIGFAPSALVWHHRRSTVRAYWKQQAGYGRSEAMLQLKHPHRFNRLGYSQWLGVIYGEGAAGQAVCSPEVYHGQFGLGMFQIIYRRNDYSMWAYFTLFEWHVLALMILTLSPLLWPMAAVAGAMWTLSLLAGLRSAVRAQLPRGAPPWCRPLVLALHLGQPVVRAWHRYKRRLKSLRLPAILADDTAIAPCSKRVSFREHDLYFTSDAALGRAELLDALVRHARVAGWAGDFSAEWMAHDVELLCDLLHNVHIYTATEELGWPRRFTRVRCLLRLAGRGKLVLMTVAVWTVLLPLTMHGRWPLAIGAVLWAVLISWIGISASRCRSAASRLVFNAATEAKLAPAPIKPPVSAARPAQTNGNELVDEDGESPFLDAH